MIAINQLEEQQENEEKSVPTSIVLKSIQKLFTPDQVKKTFSCMSDNDNDDDDVVQLCCHYLNDTSDEFKIDSYESELGVNVSKEFDSTPKEDSSLTTCNSIISSSVTTNKRRKNSKLFLKIYNNSNTTETETQGKVRM